DTVNWTEGGVNTGNGEQPYNTNSLVAQWNFNETSGTTLTASSSGSCTTACNGTLTNFAYTASQDQATTTTGWTANNKKWPASPSQGGGAGALMMESAASADYVSVSDPASNVLDPNSADLTIETWIKTNDASAEIFSNNNANGTACTNNGYYLGVDASGYPAFYLDTNGATAGCDASTTSQFKINDGNWHQVAVSVTRGTSAVIYVDGKAAGSDTSITSYSAITVTGNAFFGGSAGGLDAILDSTHIYSRALSAAEILSNYQAGNIEIQTRSGATSDPNDGTWEAWKPTTGETQLLSLDSDAVNWRSDIMASTTIATSTDTVLKMEGTGSLKIEMGKASSTVNTGVVALWRMEETGTTTGTYLYDETANNNDATTTGTTVVDGIFGKARSFNGTSDVVSALALTGGTAVQSVDFWVYPITTTEYFVDLNGSAYVWANAGTVTATGFTSPTIYVNGAVSSVVVAGQWQHIAVTTGTALNASAPKIGKTTTNFMEGNIDEARVLSRVLSADEIAETYRMGANHHLTRQISAADLSAQTKLPFWIAADRTG
ncbi:MAG: LamG domain-containing protein, partial [Patescibacteria group bacterium]